MLLVRSKRYDYRLRALTTESDNFGLKWSQKWPHFNTQLLNYSNRHLI